jgi:hypothetical protein
VRLHRPCSFSGFRSPSGAENGADTSSTALHESRCRRGAAQPDGQPIGDPLRGCRPLSSRLLPSSVVLYGDHDACGARSTVVKVNLGQITRWSLNSVAHRRTGGHRTELQLDVAAVARKASYVHLAGSARRVSAKAIFGRAANRPQGRTARRQRSKDLDRTLRSPVAPNGIEPSSSNALVRPAVVA